jgi:riboflavin transporter FmnP
MKTSRDLALIAMFAAISFVFNVLIGQLPGLITGLAGMAYVFTIVYSIIQSVAYLMYGGRRWRILAQALLLSLLYFLFIPGWTLPVAMATILNMFIVDLVFNSFHGKFERDNRLFRWILALQVYSWTAHSFLVLPFLSLFIPMEAVTAYFLLLVTAMLPVIIVEAVAGSFIGYKIFGRVEKISG